ncbi:hypothetical protein PWG14_07280 (plasmid) [Chromobacterium amazonense]|uniref:hypothetical protein n=1 Tax=Chromobacterium amazonense TaxID=1382803 RepID=UPI00237EA085|nr:hypothetical protein [Chromobacterium amazonense]MDE1712509.1 hypothetical protein [Chromobacterium amazonense]
MNGLLAYENTRILSVLHRTQEIFFVLIMAPHQGRNRCGRRKIAAARGPENHADPAWFDKNPEHRMRLNAI